MSGLVSNALQNVKTCVKVMIFAASLSVMGLSASHVYAQLPEPPAPPEAPAAAGSGSTGSSGSGNQASIPTLSEWGVLFFTMFISGVAVYRIRQTVSDGKLQD